jgi:hypothetical protein
MTQRPEDPTRDGIEPVATDDPAETTDPDEGPASRPTGAARHRTEPEKEDPDAGPASEPGPAASQS